MPRTLPWIALLACLLTMGTALADGKLYRWTDTEGHVHYSDTPQGNAQEVDVHALSSSQVPPAPGPGAASAEECQRKSQQLASYKGAASITETDALGNKKEYSEDERAKLIDQTQQFVDQRCGNVSSSAP